MPIVTFSIGVDDEVLRTYKVTLPPTYNASNLVTSISEPGFSMVGPVNEQPLEVHCKVGAVTRHVPIDMEAIVSPPQGEKAKPTVSSGPEASTSERADGETSNVVGQTDQLTPDQSDKEQIDVDPTKVLKQSREAMEIDTNGKEAADHKAQEIPTPPTLRATAKTRGPQTLPSAMVKLEREDSDNWFSHLDTDSDEESLFGRRGKTEMRPQSSKKRIKHAIAKKIRAAKPPSKPTTYLRQFNTSHYRRYDFLKPNAGRFAQHPFTQTQFQVYDDYALVHAGVLRPDDLRSKTFPRVGVRLDDKLLGYALASFSNKELNKRWPADFDKKGMPRARRVPLGAAYKVKVSLGELDAEGEPCTDPGLYYGWWKGLHALVGTERFGRYMVRPSREEKKSEGMSWKVGWKAIVQDQES